MRLKLRLRLCTITWAIQKRLKLRFRTYLESRGGQWDDNEDVEIKDEEGEIQYID